mmetsp:Transcript_47691/g.63016  ORF Transcript_47691/g.63016 Transcript_47691/m.63016 type:complete len:109 (+) Transcript_47691:473-799(+)
MLQEKQISCDYAVTGAEALTALRTRIDLVERGLVKSNYRFILCDYSMPEMDGPTTALEIRRMLRDSKLTTPQKELYICCVSAYADKSFITVALQAGMNKFITKPISDA